MELQEIWGLAGKRVTRSGLAGGEFSVRVTLIVMMVTGFVCATASMSGAGCCAAFVPGVHRACH